MPTIRDFLECVVPHMQGTPPELVFEEGMEYGGLAGTAHLIRVNGVAFAVTATHVVAPGLPGHVPPDPRRFVQSVRLRQHAESRTFLDIDHASWVNRSGDVDTDIMVFAFDESAIALSEPAATIHHVHESRLASLREGDHLVTRGFMRDAGSIDGDTFKIRTGALGTNGIYAGADRDAGQHVHVLRFAKPFASDGIVQGLSGSPVFAVRFEGQLLLAVSYAGMILRGGAESARFVHAAVILETCRQALAARDANRRGSE